MLISKSASFIFWTLKAHFLSLYLQQFFLLFINSLQRHLTPNCELDAMWISTKRQRPNWWLSNFKCIELHMRISASVNIYQHSSCSTLRRRTNGSINFYATASDWVSYEEMMSGSMPLLLLWQTRWILPHSADGFATDRDVWHKSTDCAWVGALFAHGKRLIELRRMMVNLRCENGRVIWSVLHTW